ncbi:Malate synthase, glyoxysomal [Gryllus bimaculatus]|nr:Malate synthase, glyoxysomal [Gryllus bimaculatus]
MKMIENTPSNPNDISIILEPCPVGLETAYNTLYSPDAIQFIAELVSTFDTRIEQLYWKRLTTKCTYQKLDQLPKFRNSPERHEKHWKVAPLPQRLQNRHLDLGDVSPANTDHFKKALLADVQGIQVDFDDGHCPTWKNQLIGLYNIFKVVHGQFSGIPSLSTLPILMLRPRAWNMIEHNMMVNGKEVPGPLFDFGVLVFHNAHELFKEGSGPFFYLSKLEGADEAELWNDIFVWAQQKLQIPYGTIKACVLIENILSSFEMDEILYKLKDHSLGLNCGIWDYAASIISKFGHKKNFMLPDRNKYVNMSRHFLKSYMLLVIKTCHKRGAHATGGMAAQSLSMENTSRNSEIIENVCKSKLQEISAGVDGFMVYDIGLVPYINKLWKQHAPEPNQLSVLPNESVSPEDLLQMPTGGVTVNGMKHNVQVAILFIYYWFQGRGHFEFKGAVEDSATAEISRSQIWQWIRHKASMEDVNGIVSKHLVSKFASEFITECKKNNQFCNSIDDYQKIIAAKEIFLELVTKREFPDFITTFLNNNYIFWHFHKHSISSGPKCHL